VIESGRVVPFVCVYGYDRGVTEATVDNGMTRSASQVLNYEIHGGAPRIVPIIKSIMFGDSQGRIANSEVVGLYEQLKDTIDFVLHCFPSTVLKITRAPVLGAFGRGLLAFPEYRDRLADAAQKLRDVTMERDGDFAIRALYKYLTHVGVVPQDVLYRKAARMLFAHCRGEHLDKVIEATRDPFVVKLAVLSK
jgi:hypothetical protein